MGSCPHAAAPAVPSLRGYHPTLAGAWAAYTYGISASWRGVHGERQLCDAARVAHVGPVARVLGVGPSQVVPFGESLDRGLSVQGPVGSSVVVVVEEAGERGAALGVGGVDAAVGPALGHGLDE